MKNGIIQLDDSLIIGKGGERICYRHPFEPTLCIKIKYKNIINSHGRISRPQNESEFKYYSRLKKRSISWKHITKCYGWVDTNKGKGLVFDFITDSKGAALQTLDKLFADGSISQAEILRQIDYLYKYFLDNRVLPIGIQLNNMIYNPDMEGECKIVMIDDVGDRNFFVPFIQKSKLLTKLRLNKKFNSFYERFSNRCGLD